MPEAYVIEAFSASGELKYKWRATRISHEANLLVLYGAWNRVLDQAEGTQSLITNQSLEFYWSDQGYTISALYDQSGHLQEFYARALQKPPQIDESAAKLEIRLTGSDLQISPSFKYDIISGTDDETDELASADGWLELFITLERREGPFDRSFRAPYEQLAGLM